MHIGLFVDGIAKTYTVFMERSTFKFLLTWRNDIETFADIS